MKRPNVWLARRKGKNGTHYLVRWIEPDSGKNRGRTFGRLEDARMYQAQLRRDFETNSYFSPVRITYGEWVERHLENMANSPDVDVSPKTVAGHREALAALGRVCQVKSPLDITPKLIKVFRRRQLENGLSARTINKHVSAIRSALSYAVRDEVIPENKLLGQNRLMLRTEQKPPRILEVGELTALMNTATDLRQKLVISLGYYHGLRRAEICYLQWQDVDLEDYRLSVIDREGARTKTRRSRTIALRRETAEIFAKLAPDRVNEFVFVNPGAYYWSVSVWFEQLVRAAGLDPCTLHDLRKTCNTIMQDAGVSQEAAMQVLGHTSAQVNRDHYTGILVEQQRKAINALPSIG